MQEANAMTRDPALADVQDMLSNAEGQEQVIEWLKNPVTLKLITAARVIAKPQAPSQELKSSDYLLGESCGANKIIDFFVRPQGVVPRAPVNLSRTYGAGVKIKEETKDA